MPNGAVVDYARPFSGNSAHDQHNLDPKRGARAFQEHPQYSSTEAGAPRSLLRRVQGAAEIEIDHFTVRFEDGQFEMIVGGRQSGRIDCRLAYHFLEDVADNQERYISQPELFDWTWLAGLLDSMNEPDGADAAGNPAQ